jgi:hypothetical protein
VVGRLGDVIHLLVEGSPLCDHLLSVTHECDPAHFVPTLGLIDHLEELGKCLVTFSLNTDVRRIIVEEELRVRGGVGPAENHRLAKLTLDDLSKLAGASGVRGQ